MSDPVIVIARLFPKDGFAKVMLEAMGPAVRGIRAESGCTFYAFHLADDETIVIIEKWASPRHFDAHRSSENTKAVRAVRAPFEARPATVELLTPVELGDPMRGNL